MYPDESFEPVVRFMVVSDIHYKDEVTIEHERFEKAIRTANRLSKADKKYDKLDAIYIVGDFATSGSERQMLDIKKTLDDNVLPETQYCLLLASHEFSPTNGGESAARERFTRIFGQEHDQHRVINGFHFLSIACTEGCHFREPQQNWTARELEKAVADDTRRPIFFFQHPHILDTVCGSIAWGENELTPILMNYPQIIDFSGHSHAPINDPRSVHQRHFTCFGTGTLSYFELDEFDKIYDTVPPRANEAAQMLIVEADRNGAVRCYPYDLISDDFFPKYWSVDTPWDVDSFVYTDARMKNTYSPYFPEDARISAQPGEGSVKISFTQAKDDEELYVDDYVITVYREDGSVIRSASIFSEYYFQPLPQELSVELEIPSGKYTCKVFANSFWRVKSRNCLETEFTV